MKKKLSLNPSMVCFGEVLWDIFPDKKMPGGAPMNVAYHLNKLGIKCDIISCVGQDEQGKKLLEQLNNWNITTDFIGIDELHLTGTVNLITDNKNEIDYTITEQVAWDFIQPLDAYKALVNNAGILIFGTLAMRNETSYSTLLQLLDVAKVKVLDINIRMPFFSIEKVIKILPRISVLKLNIAELHYIIDELKIEITGEETLRCKYLQQRFGIEEIILTKGSNGATYFRKTFNMNYTAYPIVVNDTVGSGDAFLAGFLAARFNEKTCNDNFSIMDKAIAVGAFITTKEGACPSYTLQDLINFHSQHQHVHIG